MSTNSPTYGQVDRDYGMRLATTPPDDDGPVWMVNLMKYREVAQYADGRESKSFHSQDGLGLKLLADFGIEVALITARDSPIVFEPTPVSGIVALSYGF